MFCGCLEIVHRPQLFATFFGHICGKISNFQLFFIMCDHCGIKTVDIYALIVRVVIINCQDFYPFQDWEDYLPISNFNFLFSWGHFTYACQWVNKIRWNWYILWILVSYILILKLSKKPNLISRRFTDSWFIFSEKAA